MSAKCKCNVIIQQWLSVIFIDWGRIILHQNDGGQRKRKCRCCAAINTFQNPIAGGGSAIVGLFTQRLCIIGAAKAHHFSTFAHTGPSISSIMPHQCVLGSALCTLPLSLYVSPFGQNLQLWNTFPLLPGRYLGRLSACAHKSR